MTRLFISILLGLYLAGCAPEFYGRSQKEPLLPDARSLWQLRIGDDKNPRFTGLLALRNSGSGLDVVLLDSTGIKLLSEKITPDGGIEVLESVPIIKEKGIPGFLGQGLHRIFMPGNGNRSESCFQDYLIRKCYGRNVNGILVKSAGFGPFKLWSVEYFINKNRDAFYLSGVTLEQGLFKPDIRLERMDESRVKKN